MKLFLRQKVFTIGDKLTFFDKDKKPVYYVKGSIFKIPHRLIMTDAEGRELTIVKTKLFNLFKTYDVIDIQENRVVGKVKRSFSFNKNFNININDESFLIKGSLFGYHFDLINQNGEVVVTVKKEIISWGDVYEVFIDETKIKPEIACSLCIAFDNDIHSYKND